MQCDIVPLFERKVVHCRTDQYIVSAAKLKADNYNMNNNNTSHDARWRGFVVEETMRKKFSINYHDAGKSRGEDFVVNGVPIECKGVSTGTKWDPKKNMHHVLFYFANLTIPAAERVLEHNPLVIFGMVNHAMTDVVFVGGLYGKAMKAHMKFMVKGEYQSDRAIMQFDGYTCPVSDLIPIEQLLDLQTFEPLPRVLMKYNHV